MHIISEIVQVKVNGHWYDAEILDTGSEPFGPIYVYIFDLRIKKHINFRDVR